MNCLKNYFHVKKLKALINKSLYSKSDAKALATFQKTIDKILEEGLGAQDATLYELKADLHLYAKEFKLAVKALSQAITLRYTPNRARKIAGLLLGLSPQALKRSFKFIGKFGPETIFWEETLAKAPPFHKPLIMKRLQFIYEFGKASSKDKEYLPDFEKALSYKVAKTLKVKATPTIPIVLICDNNFVPHAGVTIASCLYYGEPDTVYEFHILSDVEGISKENQKKLGELKRIKTCTFHYHLFNSALIPQAAKDILEDSRYPILILFRFFYPDIFKKYDRIISLDADIVVKSDLTSLYDYSNDSKHSIFATSDPSPEERNLHLGLPRSRQYINCGVMVMNLKKLREMNFSLEAVKLTLSKTTIFKLVEQDVMNFGFAGEIQCIPPFWNTPPRALLYKKYLGYNVGPFWPRIIHFIMIKKAGRRFLFKSSIEKRVKPWKNPDNAQALWKKSPPKIPFYLRDYWAFRDLTPWKN